MPIAIYRHMKLFMAVPNYPNPIVKVFSSRQARDPIAIRLQDDTEAIFVHFTELHRRKRLRTHVEEIWHFNRNKVEIIHQQRRNDRVIHKRAESIPPLQSRIWTQNNRIEEITQQFEEGIATRCIVERHLLKYLPNPYDYSVLQLDFRNQHNVFILDVPTKCLHSLRSLSDVERDAITNQSESADAWIDLLTK